MHPISQGKIQLFWCYHGVTYNFIQNHNHCRDLHQFFSCLFETFGTMSEIMFSCESMSIFFSTAENTWMSTFVYNIIVLEWLGNNGSKMWEWHEFPPLPLQLISIVINIQAILDFQNNLYFKETQQTNAKVACHLWKKRVFHQKGRFPCE